MSKIKKLNWTVANQNNREISVVYKRRSSDTYGWDSEDKIILFAGGDFEDSDINEDCLINPDEKELVDFRKKAKKCKANWEVTIKRRLFVAQAVADKLNKINFIPYLVKGKMK